MQIVMHSNRWTFSGLSLLFLTLLFLATALSGCAEGPAAAAPIAAPPVAQTESSSVSAEGEVVPQTAVDLAFQTSGTVAAVLVEEGMVVEAGDPLMRLEATDLELALRQAQARLASAESGLTAAQNQLALAEARVATAQGQVSAAEANLALVQAGPLPEQIAAAESNLAAAQSRIVQAAGNRDQALNVATESDILQAEANLARAMADLNALEESYQQILDSCYINDSGNEVCPLLGTVEEATRDQLAVARLQKEAAQATLNFLRGGPTEAQTQAAYGGVAVAIANRDAAQAELDLLLAGPQPAQISIAEAGVQQAQARVKLVEADVAEAQAAVSQAEAALEAAQATVDAAQVQLDRMTILAPAAGTIARIHVKANELISVSTPVITLADLSGWLVKTTTLTELDIALVEVGSEAVVRLDAIPNESLNGTVTDIGFVAGLSQGDVVYEVTIQLNPADELPVRWGMTALVEIPAP